jgi:hypothetical protein
LKVWCELTIFSSENFWGMALFAEKKLWGMAVFCELRGCDFEK